MAKRPLSPKAREELESLVEDLFGLGSSAGSYFALDLPVPGWVGNEVLSFLAASDCVTIQSVHFANRTMRDAYLRQFGDLSGTVVVTPNADDDALEEAGYGSEKYDDTLICVTLSGENVPALRQALSFT